MRILKQSTAKDVMIGPFVDATDAVTEESGLGTEIDSNLWLSKSGADFVARNSSTVPAEDSNRTGWYKVNLDGTDTGTVGSLEITVHNPTVHLPVWHEFEVLPANAYDSLVGGTDNLEVDVTAIAGETTSATKLERSASTMVTATVVTDQTASQTEIYTDLTETTNDHYVGRIVIFTTGALAGQAADISAYNGTTKVLTVSQLTEAPSATNTIVIV